MGIGISIFLLAVGAILTFAVDVTTNGVNLDTVGVVLMVVGAIGLLMSMLFWSSFALRSSGPRVDSSPISRRPQGDGYSACFRRLTGDGRRLEDGGARVAV